MSNPERQNILRSQTSAKRGIPIYLHCTVEHQEKGFAKQKNPQKNQMESLPPPQLYKLFLKPIDHWHGQNIQTIINLITYPHTKYTWYTTTPKISVLGQFSYFFPSNTGTHPPTSSYLIFRNIFYFAPYRMVITSF